MTLISVVFYGQIGDPFKADGEMMHVYTDGKPPVLTRTKDGAQVFKIHKPPISSSTSPRALSIESVRFPGYFLYATPANELKLKIPKTEEDSKKHSLQYFLVTVTVQETRERTAHLFIAIGAFWELSSF